MKFVLGQQLISSHIESVTCRTTQSLLPYVFGLAEILAEVLLIPDHHKY